MTMKVATTPVTRRGRKRMSLTDPIGNATFPGGVFFLLDRIKENDTTEKPPLLERPPRLHEKELHGSEAFIAADTNEETSTTANSTPCSSPPTSWKSTETNSFYQHQPLIISDPEKDEPIKDEAEALGQVMERSRRLPGTWYYSSNHVMVNQERTKRVMAPLTRLSDLDAIAKKHAEAMASQCRLFHSNPVDLHSSFQRPSRRMGENVACGASIRDIHKAMMNNKSDKHNILHRRYTHMGMATAKGVDDGQLYLCQVFRG